MTLQAFILDEPMLTKTVSIIKIENKEQIKYHKLFIRQSTCQASVTAAIANLCSNFTEEERKESKMTIVTKDGNIEIIPELLKETQFMQYEIIVWEEKPITQENKIIEKVNRSLIEEKRGFAKYIGDLETPVVQKLRNENKDINSLLRQKLKIFEGKITPKASAAGSKASPTVAESLKIHSSFPLDTRSSSMSRSFRHDCDHDYEDHETDLLFNHSLILKNT